MSVYAICFGRDSITLPLEFDGMCMLTFTALILLEFQPNRCEPLPNRCEPN